MFRKYYKDANNDIVPSDELINRVIENVNKKQPPTKYQKYQKYAVPLAAAVLVVSATVISMPFFENARDDGVIIENSVVQTPLPTGRNASSGSENEHTPISSAIPTLQPKAVSPPVNDYYNSKTEEPVKNNTSKQSYNNYGNSQNTSSATAKPKKPQNTQDFSAVVEPVLDENITDTKLQETTERERERSDLEAADGGKQDDTALNSIMRSEPEPFNNKISQDVSENNLENLTANEESDYSETETESTANIAMAGGGKNDLAMAEGMYKSSAADTDIAKDDYSDNYSSMIASDASASVTSAPSTVSIPEPYGYYTKSKTSNSVVFASDAGGYISVSYRYGDYSYSEPVYGMSEDNISVYLTTSGVEYNIYAVGADYSSVEELVGLIM